MEGSSASSTVQASKKTAPAAASAPWASATVFLGGMAEEGGEEAFLGEEAFSPVPSPPPSPPFSPSPLPPILFDSTTAFSLSASNSEGSTATSDGSADPALKSGLEVPRRCCPCPC